MEMWLFSKLWRGKFNRNGQRNELELPLGKGDVESGAIFYFKNKQTEKPQTRTYVKLVLFHSSLAVCSDMWKIFAGMLPCLPRFVCGPTSPCWDGHFSQSQAHCQVGFPLSSLQPSPLSLCKNVLLAAPGSPPLEADLCQLSLSSWSFSNVCAGEELVSKRLQAALQWESPSYAVCCAEVHLFLCFIQ